LVRSTNASPGDIPVTGSQAENLFSQTCGVSDKGRAALEVAAARNGFVQNPDTTTYFHPNLDLSVKLRDDGRCSLVFVSTQSPQTVKVPFDALNVSGRNVDFRDRGVISGEHYFSISI